jgi:hypothetical protein
MKSNIFYSINAYNIINSYSVLCSDAFLGFIPKEDQHAEINKIRDTTIILRDVIIPEFARELNKGID